MGAQSARTFHPMSVLFLAALSVVPVVAWWAPSAPSLRSCRPTASGFPRKEEAHRQHRVVVLGSAPPRLGDPADEMWPPLPAGTPITPLGKEHRRQAKLAGAGALPGVAVSALKAKELAEVPLAVVHPLRLDHPNLRLVHADPPVFAVPDLLPPDACDAMVRLALDPATPPDVALEVASPTFGGGGGSAMMAAARTSTTWFLKYGAVRPLVDAVSALLKDVDPTHFEEPQLVRYEPGQQFKWHLDQVPESLLENGGQRLATTIVYLNDLDEDLPGSGATTFRELGINVAPKKGMALLFFPAFAKGGTIGGGDDEAGEGGDEEEGGDGKVKRKPPVKKKKKKKGKASGPATTPLRFEAGDGDERTLHAGAAPVFGTKWIAQIWTHERPYEPKVPPGNTH